MAKLRSRVTFFAPRADGSEVFVGVGQEVDADSPVVKGRESLFEAVEGDEPVQRVAVKKAAKKAAKP